MFSSPFPQVILTHQVQYADHMKELLESMETKLQRQEELSGIWYMAHDMVDNIHLIILAAITQFNTHLFHYLSSLVRKVSECVYDFLFRFIFT